MSFDRNRTIVLCASFAPSLINFRLDLIRDMRDAGCQVTAVAPRDELVSAALMDIGVEYSAVNVSATGMNPLEDMGYYRRLLDVFRRSRCSGVLSYTHKPVLYGTIAAKRCGIPTRVAMITGLGYAFIDGRGLKKRVVRSAIRYLYRRAGACCTHAVFQNADDRNDFLKMRLIKPSTPASVVPGSGVNLDRFPMRPIPKDRMRFLMLSRLLGDKGVREFASAAESVRDYSRGIEFLLAGAMSRNPAAIGHNELEYWTKSHILSYLGDLRDVRPSLERCSVYVLPSYREGMPRSVLEAMSTGRPIITTDVPGCRETIQRAGSPDRFGLRRGVNGFLVPPRDPPALAKAMLEFIQTPSLLDTMGAASRRIAEDAFDVRIVNRHILGALGIG